MFTNQNKYKNHKYFMTLALAQAKITLGNTKDNPAVGCVITKNDHMISAGHTSINGRPHAEDNAINLSNINPANSRLYVTLEPCSHYGKTPPCVKTIIQKKISKVFFSVNDPDPRSLNKCSTQLKKNGINVNSGILKNKINLFYRSYFKLKSKKLPFVTCKLAVSKDNYTVDKNNKWITNEFSRKRVHLMRAYHDCLMTSSKTIISDNPRLTCRINGLENRSPSRIILDRKLKIPLNSKIINEASKYTTIIFYNINNSKKIKILKKLNIKVYKIRTNKLGNLDLKESLIKAKKLGFSRIFLESGVKLANSFFNENLIDDFKLFISAKNLKRNGDKNIKKYYRLFLSNKKKIIEKVNLFEDKLISYKLK